jgi:hypothetical protein
LFDQFFNVRSHDYAASWKRVEDALKEPGDYDRLAGSRRHDDKRVRRDRASVRRRPAMLAKVREQRVNGFFLIPTIRKRRSAVVADRRERVHTIRLYCGQPTGINSRGMIAS